MSPVSSKKVVASIILKIKKHVYFLLIINYCCHYI